MNWINDFSESIDEFFSNKSEAEYKKFKSENKNLRRKGDIFKHIRNICKTDSKNSIKHTYLVLFEQIKKIRRRIFKRFNKYK